jgi:hypothetical protein
VGKLKVKKSGKRITDPYDKYHVSADSLDQIPVIKLSPIVKLYRSKRIENLFNVLIKFNMFRDEDWNKCFKYMNKNDMRVKVMIRFNYGKTYIRIRT